MSDSERSAEPIRRHDEPPSHLHPLSPTRAQREASRLTPAARLPRTPTRLELQPASNYSPPRPQLASNAPHLAPHQQPTGGGQRAQRFAYSEVRRDIIVFSTRITDESEPRSESHAGRRLPASNYSPPRTIPTSRPISSRRATDSERSAERVDRRPSAACLEPQTASNHTASNHPPLTNAKKRADRPHISACSRPARSFCASKRPFLLYLILPISMLISSAFTLCVSAPTEMTSTPAAAAAASVVSSMPPDASTTAR